MRKYVGIFLSPLMAIGLVTNASAKTLVATVGPNTKATAYEAFNLSGEVCMEAVDRADQSAVAVKWWTIEPFGATRDLGSAASMCHDFFGTTKIRVGFGFKDAVIDIYITSLETRVVHQPDPCGPKCL